MPSILKTANLGNVVLPSLWNVNPFLLIGVLLVFVLLLFYFLENGPQRRDRMN